MLYLLCRMNVLFEKKSFVYYIIKMFEETFVF